MNHTIICGSIICKDESVLLVQERKDSAYEEWNLPTGKVEIGESLTGCAVREAMEETGLSVEPKSVVGIYSKPGEKSDSVVAVIFYAETNEYKLDPDYNEVLDAEWVSLDKINNKDLRSSHIQPAIRRYTSGDTYPLDVVSSLERK